MMKSAAPRLTPLLFFLAQNACDGREPEGVPAVSPMPSAPDAMDPPVYVEDTTGIAAPSTYRGYQSINVWVRERVVFAPEAFELSAYLGDGGRDLTELLGAWTGFGVENEFRNGRPNAINYAIWRLMLTSFARDVAALCPGSSTPPEIEGLALLPSVVEALGVLCTWPAPEARSQPALEAIWVAFMGYEAPRPELEAWRDEFLHEDYAGSSAEQAISWMLSALFMNPHFLLEK